MKVLVFVIVKPPEWSCLHTAYSLGLVFNEKDSLVSWSRYLIYIGKFCVLVGSSWRVQKMCEMFAIWVWVLQKTLLSEGWAGVCVGMCHGLRNTGLKLARLILLELAKITWSQRWDQAWKISVFEEAVKMGSGRWGRNVVCVSHANRSVLLPSPVRSTCTQHMHLKLLCQVWTELSKGGNMLLGCLLHIFITKLYKNKGEKP